MNRDRSVLAWLRALLCCLVVGLFKCSIPSPAAEPTAHPPAQDAWADFVETNFPFFSSVLDARNVGHGLPSDNLTPRGIILNLGNECWACFDIDLLRMSAVWVGQGVSPVSMSQGSYHSPGTKAPEGQNSLPQIVGTPWLANGIYPGWQEGEQFSLTDPREPAGLAFSDQLLTRVGLPPCVPVQVLQRREPLLVVVHARLAIRVTRIVVACSKVA